MTENKNYRKCLGNKQKYAPTGAICKNCMWKDVCEERIINQDLKNERIREIANEVRQAELENLNKVVR